VSRKLFLQSLSLGPKAAVEPPSSKRKGAKYKERRQEGTSSWGLLNLSVSDEEERVMSAGYSGQAKIHMGFYSLIF